MSLYIGSNRITPVIGSTTGSGNIDNLTITKNTDNELQAVGVINQNSASEATNPLQLWEGTEAEWNVGGGNKTWYNWEEGLPDEFIADSTALPASSTWWRTVYGNGKYIAVSKAGTSAVSTDGQSWTSGGSMTGSSSNIRRVYFLNNQFIATGKQGRIYTTSDGLTWANANSQGGTYSSINLSQTIAYNGSYYVAANSIEYDSNGRLCYSYDLNNWNILDVGVSPVVVYDSIYGEYNGKGYFMFIGETRGSSSSSQVTGGDIYTALSTNSPTDLSPYSLGLSHDYFNIVYNGKGKFLAIGIRYFNNTASNPTIAYIDITGNTPVATEIITVTQQRFFSVKYSNNTYYLIGQATNAFAVAASTTVGVLKESKLEEFLSAVNLDPTTSLDDYIDYVSITSARWTDIVISPDRKIATIASDSKYAGYAINVSYYTDINNPTTTDTVYSAPNVESELTITSVGTGTITLSDTETYTYNSTGNQVTAKNVGEEYPNLLCNVREVGLKKGNNYIANYNVNFVGTDGSATGSSGLVPAPAVSDSSKFLKSDGTWSTLPPADQTYDSTSTNAVSGVAISDGKFLQNNATGTDSLAIGPSSSASTIDSVAIGYSANVTANYSVSIGCDADINSTYAIGVGYKAQSKATYAIQLGRGTNSEANSFYVGLSSSNNYKLLGSNGKIPNDRLTLDTTPTENSTNAITSGAIYTVLGDIETALDAIIAQGSNSK